MPHISYVDPATVDDPELQAIMERARLYGTPRPESQAIRLHHPEVMKAFNTAWEVFFRQGVADHAIKELCRLYIAKSVECEYCGGQRSVLAQQQGASEAQVDEILDFENSTRFDERERTALEWAMAIAWDPTLAADDLWDRLHLSFHRASAGRTWALHRVDAGTAAVPQDRGCPSRRGARGHRCGPGSAGGRAAAFRERGRSFVVARPAVAESSRYKSDGDWGTRPNSGSERARGSTSARSGRSVASGPTASSHTPRQRQPTSASSAATPPG